VKTLVNGNNPFGPNTLLRPTPGSKSAFDAVALSNVPLAFGWGSDEDDIIDIDCCCGCCARTTDRPSVPENIARDSKSINPENMARESLDMFLLEDLDILITSLIETKKIALYLKDRVVLK
jgi:hypothetical protein